MNAGIAVWFSVMLFATVTVATTITESFAESDATVADPEFGYNSIAGEIANDPIAQEILEKIEKTRQQIEQAEKHAKVEQEIQEKRDKSLAGLQEDLAIMEAEYEHMTFEYRLEKMKNQTTVEYAQENWHNNTASIGEYEKVLKRGGTEQEAANAAIQISTRIYGILYDNLSYTHSKIKDGQRAFELVISNGGTSKQAQTAYASAAQISHSDMIAINALNNIKHNMAYYNQQILFGHDGQFDDSLSGDLLRLYYQDYRLNPSYILANPDDPSWKTIGRIAADTECRIEHVLVYRNQTEDYVCTTDSTAELWQRNGMGEIAWISANPDDRSIAEFQKDRIDKKVENANKRIDSMISSYNYKLDDLDKKYRERYAEVQEEMEEEKSNITDPDLLAEIQNKYELKLDMMAQDKMRYAQMVEDSQAESQGEILDLYKDDKDVRIIGDVEAGTLQAVKKMSQV